MTSLSSLGSRGSSSSAQPVLELAAPRLEHRDLGPERLVLGGQLAGRRQVAAELGQRPVGLDDRGQLGVALAHAARPVLVGVHRRVGELPLEPGVLGEQLGGCLDHGVPLQHRANKSSRVRRRRRSAPVMGAGRRRCGSYLEPVEPVLPKRFSNRATRPPVSRIFCLPV